MTVRAAFAVAFLGVICSRFAFFFWLQAQHQLGTIRGSSLLYLEPFFTLAVAATVINEPVTINALLSGLTVLLGVWLVAQGTGPAPAEARVNH